MEFEECEISGLLVAEGEKGQYWIYDLSDAYLDRITPTPAGPKTEKLGRFETVEDAMSEAQRREEM